MKHGDQRKIAYSAKVTPAFLCAILKGHKRPSWQAAKRLAQVTATDPILWLEGTAGEIVAGIDAAKGERLESQVKRLRALTDFAMGA